MKVIFYERGRGQGCWDYFLGVSKYVEVGDFTHCTFISSALSNTAVVITLSYYEHSFQIISIQLLGKLESKMYIFIKHFIIIITVKYAMHVHINNEARIKSLIKPKSHNQNVGYKLYKHLTQPFVQ